MLFVPWLGTWLIYREHRRAVAQLRALEAEAFAPVVRAQSEREWTFPCDRCATPTKTRRRVPAGHVEHRCDAHLDGTQRY